MKIWQCKEIFRIYSEWGHIYSSNFMDQAIFNVQSEVVVNIFEWVWNHCLKATYPPWCISWKPVMISSSLIVPGWAMRNIVHFYSQILKNGWPASILIRPRSSWLKQIRFVPRVITWQDGLGMNSVICWGPPWLSYVHPMLPMLHLVCLKSLW